MVSFSTDDDDVDFENSSLGMWKNSYVDNLDWKFNSRSIQTIDTGPSRDHTSRSGEEYMQNQSNYSIDIYIDMSFNCSIIIPLTLKWPYIYLMVVLFVPLVTSSIWMSPDILDKQMV